MQLTHRQNQLLRELIREFTRSVTGYPFADQPDVTSRNPVLSLQVVKVPNPEFPRLGDPVYDIFDGDEGLDIDDEEPDDVDYGIARLDPYVNNYTRPSR